MSDALRPTLVVLVALGVLAFGATAVGAAQVIQRDRDRWRADSATLLAAGMVRRQVRLVQLVTTGVLAVVAVATALDDHGACITNRAAGALARPRSRARASRSTPRLRRSVWSRSS